MSLLTRNFTKMTLSAAMTPSYGSSSIDGLERSLRMKDELISKLQDTENRSIKTCMARFSPGSLPHALSSLCFPMFSLVRFCNYHLILYTIQYTVAFRLWYISSVILYLWYIRTAITRGFWDQNLVRPGSSTADYRSLTVLYFSQKQLPSKMTTRLVLIQCAGYIFW